MNPRSKTRGFLIYLGNDYKPTGSINEAKRFPGPMTSVSSMVANMKKGNFDGVLDDKCLQIVEHARANSYINEEIHKLIKVIDVETCTVENL